MGFQRVGMPGLIYTRSNVIRRRGAGFGDEFRQFVGEMRLPGISVFAAERKVAKLRRLQRFDQSLPIATQPAFAT